MDAIFPLVNPMRWFRVLLAFALLGVVFSSLIITNALGNSPPEGRDKTLSIDEDSGKTVVNLEEVFTDADGNPLEYTVLGDYHLDFNVIEDQLEITPDANWNGWENLTLIADDGESIGGATLYVQVRAVNDAPTSADILLVTNDVPPITDLTNITFLSSVRDADKEREGDHYTYIWKSNLTGSLGSSEDLTNITLGKGHHLITLNVTDKAGASVETNLSLYVRDAFESMNGQGTGSEENEGAIVTTVLVLGLILFCIIGVLIIFIYIWTRAKQIAKEEAERAEEEAMMNEDEEDEATPSEEEPSRKAGRPKRDARSSRGIKAKKREKNLGKKE
jgi:hypothetical protein